MLPYLFPFFAITIFSFICVPSANIDTWYGPLGDTMDWTPLGGISSTIIRIRPAIRSKAWRTVYGSSVCTPLGVELYTLYTLRTPIRPVPYSNTTIHVRVIYAQIAWLFLGYGQYNQLCYSNPSFRPRHRSPPRSMRPRIPIRNIF